MRAALKLDVPDLSNFRHSIVNNTLLGLDDDLIDAHLEVADSEIMARLREILNGIGTKKVCCIQYAY